MIALLALLISASPAHADLPNFEEFTEQDVIKMESIHLQQRINDARELRAKVLAFANKNGGIKKIQEFSEDNLQNAPTNIDFTTNNGLNCLAATYWAQFKCINLE